jgi:hypothetical protein
VVADPAADTPAGAADVLGAGVPLATISQGPAAAGGGPSSAPHPATTNTTLPRMAVTLANGVIGITRR